MRVFGVIVVFLVCVVSMRDWTTPWGVLVRGQGATASAVACSPIYTDDASFVQCFNGGNATCGTDLRVDPPPPPGPACNCASGWTGVQCTQCIDSSACESETGDQQRSGLSCLSAFQWTELGEQFAQGPTVGESSRGIRSGAALDCVLTDAYSVEQLGGGSVTFVCDGEEGVCQLDVFETSTAVPHVFHCEFDGCSQSSSQRNTLTSCARSSCSCSGDCTVELQALLRNIQSAAFVDCDRGTGECFISQNELPLFIRASCSALTCARPQVASEKDDPGLVAGLVLAAVYTALALIVAFVWLRCRAFDSAAARTTTTAMPMAKSLNLVCAPIPGAPQRAAGVLALSSVGYSIHGVRILHSVSVAFPPGGVHAVIGASGAGKTTLLDVMANRKTAGVLSGVVSYAGVSVRGGSGGSSGEAKSGTTPSLARTVGYVLQDVALPAHLTVREALLEAAVLKLPASMHLADIGERVSALIELLGLMDVENAVIGTSDGTGARGLSGGQARRVAIAAQLVTAPPVLIADEATSGLDAGSALDLVSMLSRYAKATGTVIIMTLHQPRPAIFSLLDSVLVLVRGSRVFHGPPDALAGALDRAGLFVPPHYAPSDYVLDVVSAHARADTGAAPLSSLLSEPTVGWSSSAPAASLGSTDALISALKAVDTYETLIPGLGRRSAGSGGVAERGPVPQQTAAGATSGVDVNALADKNDLVDKDIMDVARVSVAAKSQTTLVARVLEGQARGGSGSGGGNGSGSGSGSGSSWSGSEHEQQEADDNDGFGAFSSTTDDGDVEYYYTYSYSESSMLGGGSGGGGGGGGGAPVLPGAPLLAGPGFDLTDTRAGTGARVGPMVELTPLVPAGAAGAGAGVVEEDKSKSWMGRARARLHGGLRRVMVLLHRGVLELVRSPLLMRSHYLAAVVVGLIIGFVYYDVDGNLSGAQNMAGVLFFSVSLVSFASVSVIDTINQGRVLMTRERAAGSYGSAAWIGTKLFLDAIPLRAGPALVFASVAYFLVGLRLDAASRFFNFVLVLVLAAMAASTQTAAVTLWASSGSQASLIAVLLLLAQMLFGGLLINADGMPDALAWLQYLSFFKYAFEALMVNELANARILFDPRGFTPVFISGNVILDTYALDADNMERNMVILFVLVLGFSLLAFLGLVLRVKEQR